MSLWADIRQRRITQIVLSYIIGGWILLQVVDQVVDRDVLPRYVYVVALILFGFGIPVALIIGWNHGEKGAQKAPPSEIVLIALLTLGAGLSSWIVVRDALRAEQLTEAEWDLSRTAVFYFQGQGPDAGLVAEGLTEDLIQRLSRVPEIDVLSQNGSRQIRAAQESGVSSLELADEYELGTFLTGVVERIQDQYRVSVSIQDRTGAPLPGGNISVRGTTGDLLALRNQLAEGVESSFRQVLGSQIRLRENQSAAPNEGAWLAVTRGERAMERGIQAVLHGEEDAATQAFAEAEESLRTAAEAAPDWAEPWVVRSRLAYEASFLARSLDQLATYFDQGIAMADSALARDAGSARARSYRGTALYSRYVYGLEPSPEAAEDTRRRARADLEQATELDRTLAEPYATLSHLYYQVGDPGSAALAARQAYENDAFLRSTDVILRRLFTTNYDLQRVDQARNWCQEGRRRFPGNYVFTECELWIMTMDGVQPDIRRAWALVDSVAALAGEREAYAVAGARQVVGGIIARAGLADSASAVMTAARVGAEVDPQGELLSMEAAMRLMNDQEEEAIALLQRYTSSNPGHFGQGRGLHWWWQGLVGNDAFEQLRRLN